MLNPCRSVRFPTKREPNGASSEAPLRCRYISKHGGRHLENNIRIPVPVANSVRREIARTGAPIVVWFGLKQQECVDPGLASLLESILWPECENEFEVLR